MSESKQNRPSSLDEWEQEESVRRLMARVRHSLDETDKRLMPPPVEVVWANCTGQQGRAWRISPWWLAAASVVGFMLGWMCRFGETGSSDSLLVCDDTVQVDTSLVDRPMGEVGKLQATLPDKRLVNMGTSPAHVSHSAPSYHVPAPQREATTMEVVTGQMAVRHTAESMDWNLLVSHR